MIKLVVIDFDDTLSMTEAVAFRLENEILQLMGHSLMTREAHKKNWGASIDLAIAERAPGIDVEAFVSRFDQELPRMISESDDHDVVTDENLQALDQLRSEGMKIAILTSRTGPHIVHLLEENHPLSKRLDEFYHQDNTEFQKPDPRAFKQILQHFDVSSNEVVYIGDQPSDGTCANGAGIKFIAVLESGVRTKEDFAGIIVDHFLVKFSDIVKHLQRDN